MTEGRPGPRRTAEIFLLLAEPALRRAAVDGVRPPADLAWVLEDAARTAPHLARRLPFVRAALPPHVRAAIGAARVTELAGACDVAAGSGAAPGGTEPPSTRSALPVPPGLPVRLRAGAAAARLGVRTHAVRAAARRGRLPGVKDERGEWWFAAEEVQAYARGRARAG